MQRNKHCSKNKGKSIKKELSMKPKDLKKFNKKSRLKNKQILTRKYFISTITKKDDKKAAKKGGKGDPVPTSPL